MSMRLSSFLIYIGNFHFYSCGLQIASNDILKVTWNSVGDFFHDYEEFFDEP